jgi:hypothetical protein
MANVEVGGAGARRGHRRRQEVGDCPEVEEGPEHGTHMLVVEKERRTEAKWSLQLGLRRKRKKKISKSSKMMENPPNQRVRMPQG